MPPNNESDCPRCAEYERAFCTMRGNVDDGDTVGSLPASAWDVICKDRDEWKRRALLAEDKLAIYVMAEEFERLRDGVLVTPRNAPESPDGSTGNDSETPKGCQCRICVDARTAPEDWWMKGMILCATCGNKRCPHATNHDNACTNSNATGQAGSDYE